MCFNLLNRTQIVHAASTLQFWHVVLTSSRIFSAIPWNCRRLCAPPSTACCFLEDGSSYHSADIIIVLAILAFIFFIIPSFVFFGYSYSKYSGFSVYRGMAGVRFVSIFFNHLSNDNADIRFITTWVGCPGMACTHVLVVLLVITSMFTCCLPRISKCC